MKISDSGLAALKREEGCKLTAYTDSRGVWTIGTGHTGRVDGVAVGKNMTITRTPPTDCYATICHGWSAALLNG